MPAALVLVAADTGLPERRSFYRMASACKGRAPAADGGVSVKIPGQGAGWHGQTRLPVGLRMDRSHRDNTVKTSLTVPPAARIFSQTRWGWARKGRRAARHPGGLTFRPGSGLQAGFVTGWWGAIPQKNGPPRIIFLAGPRGMSIFLALYRNARCESHWNRSEDGFDANTPTDMY
jgi:hypothetical protein